MPERDFSARSGLLAALESQTDAVAITRGALVTRLSRTAVRGRLMGKADMPTLVTDMPTLVTALHRLDAGI